jgi:1-acyl-sn-glycerol-3-phosphate acyltransferase
MYSMRRGELLAPAIIPAMRAKLMSLFLLGLIRFLTGAQARWHGCPPKAEQRIYFANHQSHADLVMIWAALPHELRGITRPIAAKDYWTKTPFKQWITTAVFNAVYVERERTGDEDPLQPLFDALENGDSLIIFPEGTRGNAEEPQPFKAGLYNLTCKFPEVVLVPAWINNVQRVMPKGEVVPVPILCSVTFGAPIRLEAWRGARAPSWTVRGWPCWRCAMSEARHEPVPAQPHRRAAGQRAVHHRLRAVVLTHVTVFMLSLRERGDTAQAEVVQRPAG